MSRRNSASITQSCRTSHASRKSTSRTPRRRSRAISATMVPRRESPFPALWRTVCSISTEHEGATWHMAQENENEQFLGDGLYASYDGFYITLRAPRDGGDHYVRLDDSVFLAFLAFAQQLGWLEASEDDDA